MIALFVMTIIGLVFAAVAISVVGSVLVGMFVLPFLLVAGLSNEGGRTVCSARRGFGTVLCGILLLIGGIGLFDVVSMQVDAVQATTSPNYYWKTLREAVDPPKPTRDMRLTVTIGGRETEVLIAQADTSEEALTNSPDAGSDVSAEIPDESILDSDVRDAAADVPSIPRPDWIQRGSFDDGRTAVLVVKGNFADSRESAEASMLEAAASAIQARIRSEDPEAALGQWNIPPEIIDRHAVRLRHFEVERTEVSQQFIDMHRVTAQVSLTPEFRQELQQIWKPQIVGNRILLLGIGVGLVTLFIVTFAAYFHVDQRTGGRIRGRLRLALMLILIGIGVGMSMHTESIEPILKKLTNVESEQESAPVSATFKR